MFKCRTVQADGSRSRQQWVALGQYRGGEWVIVRRLCWFWPWPPADAQVWNPFERWAADKASQQRQKESSLFTWFKMSFQAFFALCSPSPPNYTALLTTSYSRWLWSFIRYFAITKNETATSKMLKFHLPPKNTAPCMFYILPPCHLMWAIQLGRTWLIPVGSVTMATTPLFFSHPDNHLAPASSNRVARLKVHDEVKMLIFSQHTWKKKH